MTPLQYPVRFSRLKRIGQSPLHYLSSLEEPSPDDRAKRFGRLVHTVVLGGTLTVFEGERRGNKWAAFKEAHPDADIMTRAEADRAHRIADALMRHKDAAHLLLSGEHEIELTWELAGRKCAGRLDVLHSSRVVELKTTTKAEPGWFCRNGQRLGYHGQLAWYADGAQIARPNEDGARAAYIVAVEQTPPFAVTTFELTGHALELGRRLYTGWFETLRRCEESGVWPSYTMVRQTFDVEEYGEVDFDDD